MTRYIDLIGKKPEEIDKELLESHKNLLENLNSIKNLKSNYKIFSYQFMEKLQDSLMDSTGYTIKEVEYRQDKASVAFKGNNLTPNSPLNGNGKDELEAIVNACDNFIANPYDYNTHSKKYLDMLKK